jgi:hypothetical protein
MEKDYSKILEKELRQEKLRGIFSGILAILVILICIVLIIAAIIYGSNYTEKVNCRTASINGFETNLFQETWFSQVCLVKISSGNYSKYLPYRNLRGFE